MTYLRWASDYEEGYCVVSTPAITDHALIYAGVPLRHNWPSDVNTRMKDDYPDDIELSDNLFGSTHAIISQRAVTILQELIPEEYVEFLPVKIINHKGREEKDPYFILHPLDVVDCIDLAGSSVEWNPLDSNEITDCLSLVLKKERIPPDIKLFRLRYWGSVIVARSDIVDELNSHNLSGLYFPEVEGYDGIG